MMTSEAESSKARLLRYGVFKHVCAELLGSLGGVVVLHQDYCGWWAPLQEMYYSSSSKALVSRHPSACVEEIVSYYCPQCLTRYHEDQVLASQHRCPNCFLCPCCNSNLRVMGIDDTRCALNCGYCGWSSIRCGLTATSKADLEAEVKRLESSSLSANAFKSVQNMLHANEKEIAVPSHSPLQTQRLRRRKSQLHMSSQPPVLRPSLDTSNSVAREGWRQEHLNAKLQESALSKDPFQLGSSCYDPQDAALLEQEKVARTTHDQNLSALRAIFEDGQTHHGKVTGIEQRLQQTSRVALVEDALLPVRVKLRHKLTKRCRKDKEEDTMSILVQPKAIPTEGDSAEVTNKGKWWWKDSCAVTACPRLYVTALPSANELELTGSSTISLMLHNQFPQSALEVTLHPPLPYAQQSPEIHSPFGNSMPLEPVIPPGFPVLQLQPSDYEYLRDENPSASANTVLFDRDGCAVSVNQHIAALTLVVRKRTQEAPSLPSDKSLLLYELRLWCSFSQGADGSSDTPVQFECIPVIFAFTLSCV